MIAVDAAVERFEALVNSVEENGKEFEARFKPLYSYLPSKDLGIDAQIPFLFQLVTSEKRIHENKLSNPLEICVLLDISGSMSGEKINQCREAIVQLATQHLNDTDIFHMIAYDDTNRIIYNNVKPSTIDKQVIRNIDVAGSTNISGAVIEGIKLLKKSGNDKHIKLMFLFSDGNANQGITDINEFGKVYLQDTEGFPMNFNSFGIGSDYNERWLTSLARVGKGDYFYISDLEQVKNMLIKSLNKYRYQIGRNANLKIMGIRPNKIISYNGAADYESILKGGKIGNIVCRDLKQSMFVIDVQDSTLPLFKYELTFESLPSYEQIVITGTYSYDRRSSDVKELLQKDSDCIVYQLVLDCGLQQSKIQEFIASRQLEQALQIKRQLIKTLTANLEHDEYGILSKVLSNEEVTLKELEQNGLTSANLKNQHQNANIMSGLARAVEKEDYEDECEEDEDMGYGGLF